MLKSTFPDELTLNFMSGPPLDHLDRALQKFDDGPFFLGQFSLVSYIFYRFNCNQNDSKIRPAVYNAHPSCNMLLQIMMPRIHVLFATELYPDFHN